MDALTPATSSEHGDKFDVQYSASGPDAVDWDHLVARYQESLRMEQALGDEHTRLEKELENLSACAGPSEVEVTTIAVAAAERDYANAHNLRDALMLQVMATPAPHAEALRFKTSLLCGEDYEFFGYAVDGLIGVYASDVLFFAGVGDRASREVLNQFLAERDNFLAGRRERDDEQYAEAVAAARADKAKALKKLEAAARRGEFEAQLGTWLDAVDAGGGRLWDDDPAKGVYLVWASTDLAQPSCDLPEARLDEIRKHRARAMSLADCALNASPLPEFVARMREWKTFSSLNNHLEVERHQMIWRLLSEARSHGLEEMVLCARA